MKVLSLVTYPRPFFTDGIAALRRKGVSVDVLEVPGMDSEADSRSALDYARFYWTVLNKTLEKYDLIHANYGLTAPFAIAQRHRPVVLSLWGSDLMGSLGWLSRRSAAFCDETIVMSEEMKRELGRAAHVIPHGIDFERFRPMDRTQAREAIGWDSEGRYVLFPYDPSRTVKNYPLAERVVGEVRDSLSDPVELRAVYGVDHDKLPLYMNASDALLLTSRREGFPNAVKEALACNLPVVSRDVGGLRERFGGIDNSYVCGSDSELPARLEEVLAGGERSNGRDHVSDLSLDGIADATIEVYRRAINR